MSAAPEVTSLRPDTSRGTIVRGVSWVSAGHVVSQLAWFASLVFVATLVSPSAFGSVSIAMVMVQIAWLLVGSGTRGSFVVAERITPAQVRYATAVNATAGLAAGLVVAALAPSLLDALAPGSDPAVLRALAFSIALYGLSIVPLALLQRELQFKRHASVNGGAALLASALCVVAALLGAGVWSLVIRQVLFQAFLAAFAWGAARSLLPAGGSGPWLSRRGARPPAAPAFLALAALSFVALNMDYVVVGRVSHVAQLGIYSLAFTIAFAPLTQFAWQIGKVLFPAAARTASPVAVSARAAKALGLTALILLPLAPVAVALAPVVLPRLFGEEWRPMVLPFQILMTAGVVHAVLGIMREFLLGSGSVGFCVRIESVWVAATAAVLVVLVHLDGIRGAALTHLLLVGPLTAAYAVWGGRRLGLSLSALWGTVRGPAALVAGETAAMTVTFALATMAGASTDLAWASAAVAAVATLVLLAAGGRRRLFRDALDLLRPARSAGATA